MFIVILFYTLTLVSSLSGFASKKSSLSQSQLPADDVPCRCGSELDYYLCCKPLHQSPETIKSPIDLIRARYSAYAADNTDFIIASTSSTSSDYEHYLATNPNKDKAFKRWAKDLRFNFKDYHFVRMEVVSSEEETADRALVVFRQLAIRKGDNTMYPTEERSTVIRTSTQGGGWLYEKGEVVRPPIDVAQVMMETWPALVGLELMPNSIDDDVAEQKEL